MAIVSVRRGPWGPADDEELRKAVGQEILVMEPYAPLRQALVQLLREEGHPALGTESAEEALSLAVTRGAALVLFGAKHPLEDGRRFLRLLERAGLRGTLPVVFLSSRVELPPGAAGVLEMPFTPAQLRSVVSRHVRGRGWGAAEVPSLH